MAQLGILQTNSSAISTPASGTTNLFYDIDGVLKQKDYTGTVTIIRILNRNFTLFFFNI
jgi:hypothetical protein